MVFHVLGTVEVDGVEPNSLRARKPRTLLATLLLHANSWVGLDELVTAIWDDAPPASAERNVTTYVWQLRKALAVTASQAGDARIDGRSGAYRLRVEPGELDRDAFEQAAKDGARALADDRAEDAVTVLQDAVALWRGRPFDGLDTEAARVEAARLSEVRWAVRERLADALEACDRGAEAIVLLTALTAEDPLRETPWCRLLTALARAGRPADALVAYRRARDQLIEELGVEPGPQLRRVHQKILAADVEAGERPSGPGPAQRRLLARLRLAPGPSFDVWAAAALADADPQALAPLLADLVECGALRTGSNGRYAIARTAEADGWAEVPLAPGADRPARDRLTAYYAHMALEAAGLVCGEPLRDVAATTAVPPLADAGAAACWLAAELDVLLVAAAQFAEQDRVGAAWRIARALQTQVDAVGAPLGWRQLLALLATQTRRIGDAQGELVVRNALGIAHWRAGQHEAALSELHAALRVAQSGAEPRTVATMLLNLAEAHESLDRSEQAYALLEQAAALLRDLHCPALSAIAEGCRIRLHHAAVQQASAGVLYRRWTHAVPPAGMVGA